VATAVRSVELADALAELHGLDIYSRALLVFRWHGRVVGTREVIVRQGHVDAAQIAAAAKAIAGWALWERWLQDSVAADAAANADEWPTATVAICTRDRTTDLARALDAVRRLSHRPLEILVIDNCPSTDATRRLVESFQDIRYALEPRRGLDVARNRALREARGEIVAFTDDDAVVEPEWLGSLLPNFGHPRVQCVTGLTLPMELETEAQEIFEHYSPFGRGFRRRVFDGAHDNPLAVGRVGAGANMAVRKAFVERLGGFDESLDAGTPTRSGGDHDLFIRILAAGARIVYDPAAVSWHRHRRTAAELIDTIHGYGVGVYAMLTRHLARRELGALKLAWQWLRGSQLPALWRALRRPTDVPAALPIAELRGCFAGPFAYAASRRRVRQERAR
jgi:glycosyltransferase involved in cell wall biosynthesis